MWNNRCLFVLNFLHPEEIPTFLYAKYIMLLRDLSCTKNDLLQLGNCTDQHLDNLITWLVRLGCIKCVSKPGAKALIGFPFGKDRVVFNSHKIYGPVMLSHVFANWKLIHTNADHLVYMIF